MSQGLNYLYQSTICASTIYISNSPVRLVSLNRFSCMFNESHCVQSHCGHFKLSVPWLVIWYQEYPDHEGVETALSPGSALTNMSLFTKFTWQRLWIRTKKRAVYCKPLETNRFPVVASIFAFCGVTLHQVGSWVCMAAFRACPQTMTTMVMSLRKLRLTFACCLNLACVAPWRCVVLK